jgi:hypothetical protein
VHTDLATNFRARSFQNKVNGIFTSDLEAGMFSNQARNSL